MLIRKGSLVDSNLLAIVTLLPNKQYLKQTNRQRGPSFSNIFALPRHFTAHDASQNGPRVQTDADLRATRATKRWICGQVARFGTNHLNGLAVVRLMVAARLEHAKRHPRDLLCVSRARPVQSPRGAVRVANRLDLNACASLINRQPSRIGEYLVDVEVAAQHVELRVETLQEADHLHRRGRCADRGEAHQVAEQHRHVVVALRLDRFACSNGPFISH